MAVARKNFSNVEKKESELTGGSEGRGIFRSSLTTRFLFSLDIVRVNCTKFTEFQHENFLVVV